ncbi:unnamed protein product [Urochloa humidicola]
MAVPLLLLAAPAIAASGFLQAFHLSFLLWPLNAALPLARDLPRACIAPPGDRLLLCRWAARLRQRRAAAAGAEAPAGRRRRRRGLGPRRGEDAVAHTMMAFDDIY